MAYQIAMQFSNNCLLDVDNRAVFFEQPCYFMDPVESKCTELLIVM